MKFRTKSDNTRSISLNMELINAYVSRWLPNTWFDISITRKKKTVSSPMRKYFFGVVMPEFLNGFGYEPEEKLVVHERLKILYFGIEPDKHGIYRPSDIPSVFGDDSDVPIDKKQGYIEWVKRKAAEEGIYIPDPGEE